MSKVYERAVVDFIGNWSGFRVRVDRDSATNDAEAWRDYAGRAIVYAAHIDNSAKLFLQAASRGDETASDWLLECFLKWWGTREFELECPDYIEDRRLRNVTLTLAQKDWSVAQEFLWDGEQSIGVEFAVGALNLGIRRYWESMRLYLVLLLIQNAGAKPSTDCRELRFAARLVLGQAQHPGGSVEAWPLNSVDDLLVNVLSLIYGNETPIARIDAFAEGLSWGSEDHVVPGWIYGWSGSANHLESMKQALSILLVALGDSRRSRVPRSAELIEQWWRDLDKLDQARTFCGDIRENVRSSDFDDGQAAAAILQRHLGKTHRFRFGRLAVAAAQTKLRKVAAHEHRISLLAKTVDASKIRAVAHSVAALTFDIADSSPPIAELVFVPRLSAPPVQYRVHDYKKYYVTGLDSDRDSGLAEYVGKEMGRLLLSTSIRRLVADLALKPVDSDMLPKSNRASNVQKRAYIEAVAAQCRALVAAGETPIVLAGNSAAGALLAFHRWGAELWQCPAPEGVTVERPADTDGERAISRINGAVVYGAETPQGDCFVIPQSRIRTIAVAGTGPDTGLAIEWRELSEERLELLLRCHATFLPSNEGRGATRQDSAN